MSNTPNWTAADIPTQTGRVAVVTGANSGIGLETTKARAAKGAEVVMARRNLQKAGAAAAAIRQEYREQSSPSYSLISPIWSRYRHLPKRLVRTTTPSIY